MYTLRKKDDKRIPIAIINEACNVIVLPFVDDATKCIMFVDGKFKLSYTKWEDEILKRKDLVEMRFVYEGDELSLHLR